MVDRARALVLASATSAVLGAAACSGDGMSQPLGGSLSVSGQVYDFQGGIPVSGTATVATTALLPSPTIQVQGSSYTIDGVPENSAFQIVASVASTYRPTYNATLEVTNADVTDVKSFTVSESMLGSLATAFGVTQMDTLGIVFMQLVDLQGNPKQNVAASNIVLAGVTSAPKFLDPALAPAPTLNSSSASGWVVLYNVPTGVVTVASPATATATLAAPSSPVAANAVTLVRATVTDGAPPPLPMNISFANDVVPIFTNRGCVACHSGNGAGKALGGLQLDGGTQKVYNELTVENPLRVQPAMPEKSLVLTMPSYEYPSDGHPNVTFTGPQDPDYIKILVWIREGAKNN